DARSTGISDLRQSRTRQLLRVSADYQIREYADDARLRYLRCHLAHRDWRELSECVAALRRAGPDVLFRARAQSGNVWPADRLGARSDDHRTVRITALADRCG